MRLSCDWDLAKKGSDLTVNKWHQISNQLSISTTIRNSFCSIRYAMVGSKRKKYRKVIEVTIKTQHTWWRVWLQSSSNFCLIHRFIQTSKNRLKIIYQTKWKKSFNELFVRYRKKACYKMKRYQKDWKRLLQDVDYIFQP